MRGKEEKKEARKQRVKSIKSVPFPSIIPCIFHSIRSPQRRGIPTKNQTKGRKSQVRRRRGSEEERRERS
jgi:hypothetical protein